MKRLIDSNIRQVPKLVFGNEPELEHLVRFLQLETIDEKSTSHLLNFSMDTVANSNMR